jgi:uncharacterized phage-associated protein
MGYGEDLVYKAMDIARYILHRCTERGRPIDNLKLQKVLYFVWAKFYKQTGKNLFEDKFLAWRYGPVIWDVYYQYRRYVASPIEVSEGFELTEDEDIIRDAVDHYCGKYVGELINKTHAAGTPWSQAYVHGRGTEISFDSIRAYCNDH